MAQNGQVFMYSLFTRDLILIPAGSKAGMEIHGGFWGSTVTGQLAQFLPWNHPINK